MADTSAPTDPKTLSRAARDLAEKQPDFATSAGLLAIHWLVHGYGYEITGADVLGAYYDTIRAAGQTGRGDEIRERIKKIVGGERVGGSVSKILARELGL